MAAHYTGAGTAITPLKTGAYANVAWPFFQTNFGVGCPSLFYQRGLYASEEMKGSHCEKLVFVWAERVIRCRGIRFNPITHV